MLLVLNIIICCTYAQFHECPGSNSQCHTRDGVRTCDPGWITACPTPLIDDCSIDCITKDFSGSKFVLINQNKNFNQAAADCVNRGMVLASIHNSTEAWDVAGLCSQQAPGLLCWIGLKREANETPFEWVDGTYNTDFNFPWFGDNPDIPLNQDACTVTHTANPAWSDWLCGNIAQPYICGLIGPTSEPTINPTPLPTNKPSETPTDIPSEMPTYNPTEMPTGNPSQIPTSNPTINPTHNPTEYPTSNPTKMSTNDPTGMPTSNPSEMPTNDPTISAICGNNKNSGPRGPIQCENDNICCDGFKCKLDKKKCVPRDKKNGKKSFTQPIDLGDNNWINYAIVFMIIANVFVTIYWLHHWYGNKVRSYEKISLELYESAIELNDV